MNFRNYIFLIVLLVGLNQLAAQALGYMGKRFSAGYGIYASPGFYGSYGLTKVNTLHEGFFEFAAGKRASVGFSARMYNATASNAAKVRVESISPPPNYTSFRDPNDHPAGLTRIKAVNYMLYGKFFREGYVAPWGKYTIVGITLNTYNAYYDPDQVYLTLKAYNSSYYYGNDDMDFYFSDFGPTQQSFKKIDIVYGAGRSRIIANRFTIDYGYNINLWACTMAIFDVNDHASGYWLKANDYISGVSKRRIREVNRFNVFLKIGVLLF